MKTKSTNHFFARAAMLLILLLMIVSVSAQTQQALAIYCEENNTLYFTYGDYFTIRDTRWFRPEGSNESLWVNEIAFGDQITASGDMRPNWFYWYARNVIITKVVFESKFANVRPTSLYAWFSNFEDLTCIEGIGNLNTSEVTTMQRMFHNCPNLTTLDLSGFNTEKVTDMSYMFQNCSNLVSIIIGDGWDTTSVTSSNSMFYNCTSIVGYDGTTYNIRKTDIAYAHVGTGGYMCKYTNNPHAVYCASNHTLYFTTPYRQINVGGPFIPEGSDDPQTVTDFWNGTDVTDTQSPNWLVYEYRQNISKVVFEPLFKNVRPKSTAWWFSYFSNIEEIQGMENLNTSEVTDMQAMFFGCSKLPSLDLIHFYTEKVTSMYAMFDGCGLLTTLDLETFDTSKVTDMTSMFWDCSNLGTILIGNGWDTSLVTQSEDMFHNCTSIVGQFGTTYDMTKTDKNMAHARPGGYMCKRIAPLNLSDNSSNTETIATAITAEEKYHVTLQGRTLYTDGDWNTLCLPFDVDDFDGTPLEGFTVKEIDTESTNDGHKTGFDSGTLYLNFKDAVNIEAGKPYIVKKFTVKEGAATPTFTAKDGTAGSQTQQGYANLIDGNTGGNMWRTSVVPAYCEFYADQPVYVTGYTLTTGSQNMNGDPTVWMLSVSADGNEPWTVIDRRNVNNSTADALPSGRTTTSDVYNVQKSGTYQYFRFDVKATAGNSFLCLSELTLQACYPSDIANIENPLFESVTISSAEPTAVTSEDGAVSFSGNYNPVSIGNEGDKSILFMGGENTLYYPNAAMNINSFRAYFQLNNGLVCGNPSQGGYGINAFVLNFGDGSEATTGIVDADFKSASQESGISNPLQQGWYSLDGRRLNGKPKPKGIYINNGRKVVIK